MIGRSTTPMRRSAFERKKPMERGEAELERRSPIKKKARKPRPDRDDPKALAACRGERCYLCLPGVTCQGASSTVPCHTNEASAGKGMGIKAPDVFTVPGCAACHRELDSGMWFTKPEKFALWRLAYARWAPYREATYGIPATPLPTEL